MSHLFTLAMEDMFEKFKDDLCILFFSCFFSHTRIDSTSLSFFLTVFLLIFPFIYLTPIYNSYCNIVFSLKCTIFCSSFHWFNMVSYRLGFPRFLSFITLKINMTLNVSCPQGRNLVFT